MASGDNIERIEVVQSNLNINSTKDHIEINETSLDNEGKFNIVFSSSLKFFNFKFQTMFIRSTRESFLFKKLKYMQPLRFKETN